MFPLNVLAIASRYLRPSNRLSLVRLTCQCVKKVNWLFYNHWKMKRGVSLRRYLRHLTAPCLLHLAKQSWFDPVKDRFLLFREMCKLQHVDAVHRILSDHSIYVSCKRNICISYAFHPVNVPLIKLLKAHGATLSNDMVYELCSCDEEVVTQLNFSQQELHHVVLASLVLRLPSTFKWAWERRKLRFSTWCNYIQMIDSYNGLNWFILPTLRNDAWFDRAQKVNPNASWVLSYKLSMRG